MSDNWSDRIKACPHFRWRPGMAFFPADHTGRRWRVLDSAWAAHACGDNTQFKTLAQHDMDSARVAQFDPATIGVLEEIVLRAWGDRAEILRVVCGIGPRMEGVSVSWWVTDAAGRRRGAGSITAPRDAGGAHYGQPSRWKAWAVLGALEAAPNA